MDTDVFNTCSFRSWCWYLHVCSVVHLRYTPGSRLHRAGENLKTAFSTRTRMKCFLSTLRLRNSVENETITGDFGFVFEENTGREIKWLSWPHDFRKAPFSKCFPSRLKRKASVFKFLRFEECFRKAPFSWRIWVEGAPRLGVEIKLRINFFLA